MKPTLEELPPKVRDLLKLELDQPAMPLAVRQRLALQLAVTGAAAAPLAKPLAARAAHAGAKLFARRLPVALVSFGLGAGAGAAVYAGIEHRRPPPPPMALSVRAPAPPAQPVPIAAVPLPAVIPTLAPVPERHRPPRAATPVAVAPTPAPSRNRALATEQTLLDIARTALTRGDSQEALYALSRHARGFPDGELAEEREVLRIQALRLAGKREEALRTMGEFKARYPKSLSLPALEASLKEGP